MVAVQGDVGAAWGRGIRKDSVSLLASSAPALRCHFTRRTVLGGPRAWVKFEALRSFKPWVPGSVGDGY